MEDKKSYPLAGNTLKVYRVLYQEGKPLGLYDIQRRANLSSPSLAHYHVTKLLNQGLISEKEGGYLVDKAIFENMIRIGKSFVPLQATFVAYFASTLVSLFVFIWPAIVSPTFLFALVVNASALGIFVYQTFDTWRKFRS